MGRPRQFSRTQRRHRRLLAMRVMSWLADYVRTAGTRRVQLQTRKDTIPVAVVASPGEPRAVVSHPVDLVFAEVCRPAFPDVVNADRRVFERGRRLLGLVADPGER